MHPVSVASSSEKLEGVPLTETLSTADEGADSVVEQLVGATLLSESDCPFSTVAARGQAEVERRLAIKFGERG